MSHRRDHSIVRRQQLDDIIRVLGDMGTGSAPSADTEFGPMSPAQLAQLKRPLSVAETIAVEEWRKSEAAKAAKAVEAAKNAKTPAEVKAAAANTVDAAKAAPPEVKAQAVAAGVAAATANTPAKVDAAKQQVQDAAKAVQASQGTFFTREAFGGLKWWQVLAGGAGVFTVGIGSYLMLRRK